MVGTACSKALRQEHVGYARENPAREFGFYSKQLLLFISRFSCICMCDVNSSSSVLFFGVEHGAIS